VECKQVHRAHGIGGSRSEPKSQQTRLRRARNLLHEHDHQHRCIASPEPCATHTAFRWDDQRATVEAASLESLRRDLRVNLWMPFGADSAPARALWLASRFPEDMTGDTSLIEQIDLISFFWTGRRVLSETVASRKWGFTEARKWPSDFHSAVADLFGGHLPAIIPRHLIEAATPIGRVLPSAAEIYGLSPSTQVIAAPYDTVAQVLGLGLLHENAAAAVSLGTSMGVFSLVRDLNPVEYSVYGPIPDVPFRGQGLYYDGLRSCASAIDLVCAMALGPKGTGPAYYDRISQCLREPSPAQMVYPLCHTSTVASGPQLEVCQ
jgi:sugar (pentulose or hexulose) kinase